MRRRLALRVVLLVFAAVAILMGLQGALQGTDGVRASGSVNDNVDSEFRYFAAWYVGAGVVAAWAARRVGTPEARFVVRVVAGTLVLGAFARVVAIATEGWPHGLFVFLIVVEVAAALVLLTLQTAVDRADTD